MTMKMTIAALGLLIANAGTARAMTCGEAEYAEQLAKYAKENADVELASAASKLASYKVTLAMAKNGLADADSEADRDYYKE